MRKFTLKCSTVDWKLNSTHFHPKMSSLGPLKTKITPKLKTPGNYCHGCDFCGVSVGLVVGVGALVVGGGRFCGDL